MRHSPLRVWAGADHEAITVEGIHGDHAGRCETSQLWALRPELVDISRLAPGTPSEISAVMATGPDAGSASMQLGEAIVNSQVAWLGQKATDLLAAFEPPSRPGALTPGNAQGSLSFDATEDIWRREIEPLLPVFVSMNTRSDEAPVDPHSPWATNATTRVFDRQ
jgi:creatinine amidohydrolase